MEKLDFVEYGQYYSINLETNEIRNDNTGKILKPWLTGGYFQVGLHMNKKRKCYRLHQLVYIAHNGLYETTKYVVDHIDRNKTNNNINNLRLATRSLNSNNLSKHKEKSFDYKSELPEAITINSECCVYYCKQYDKFYRKVSENQFRELRECKHSQHNGTYIQWKLNNKHYRFTTSNFRDLI